MQCRLWSDNMILHRSPVLQLFARKYDPHLPRRDALMVIKHFLRQANQGGISVGGLTLVFACTWTADTLARNASSCKRC